MHPSKQSDSKEIRIGLLAAVAAHLLWGVFPLFWRMLGHIEPLEVVCHRIVWACLSLLLALPWLLRSLDAEHRARVASSLRSIRTWGLYTLAAVLIANNWLTFIWAVNHQRVLEASLGYYINPLLVVLLGVVVLREHLTAAQWLAVGCASLGVLIMTIALGGLPWVSLVLATSFAVYALVKKRAPLPALIGLLLETAILSLPAMGYIFLVEMGSGGEGVLSRVDVRSILLLLLGGTVTIAPLALFTFAAKRAPLSLIGVLQYIAPTMQFLFGVFLFNEHFGRWQLLGFAFVWLALLIYAVTGIAFSRKQTEPARAESLANRS